MTYNANMKILTKEEEQEHYKYVWHVSSHVNTELTTIPVQPLKAVPLVALAAWHSVDWV